MKVKETVSGLVAGIALTTLIGGGFSLMTARAQDTKKIPAPMGKVTPWAAIKTATAKVPGQALNANFEFAEGKWVYGVMIVSGKTIKEVEVDPMTGKAGAVETVTPEDEAKEVMEELKAAIGEKTGTSETKEKPEKPVKP